MKIDPSAVFIDSVGELSDLSYNNIISIDNFIYNGTEYNRTGTCIYIYICQCIGRYPNRYYINYNAGDLLASYHVNKLRVYMNYSNGPSQSITDIKCLTYRYILDIDSISYNVSSSTYGGSSTCSGNGSYRSPGSIYSPWSLIDKLDIYLCMCINTGNTTCKLSGIDVCNSDTNSTDPIFQLNLCTKGTLSI